MADDKPSEEPPLNPEDFGLTPDDLAEMEVNALQGFQDDVEDQERRRLRGDARYDWKGYRLNSDQFGPRYGERSQFEPGYGGYERDHRQRFDDDGPDEDGGFKRPRF